MATACIKRFVPNWSAKYVPARKRLDAIPSGPRQPLNLHQISYRVQGSVQGVFFRAYTVKKAQQIGLTGFVQNASDGSVSTQPSIARCSPFIESNPLTIFVYR